MSTVQTDATQVLGGSKLVLGGIFGIEPAERSDSRLHAFAAAGGAVVETAFSYFQGRSLRAVGDWLRQNPGALDTVVKFGHDAHGRDKPLSAENVVGDVTETLSVTGLDSVGVIMLHCDDPLRAVEEIADTLTIVVDRGYGRSLGVSNWSAPRLTQLLRAMEERGHRLLTSYQYSLAVPQAGMLGDSALAADDSILDVLDEIQAPLLSWSANARGYFSRADGEHRDEHADPFDTPSNRARRARCKHLAEERGLSPATAALAWTLARNNTTYASVGVGTPEHIAEAFAATACHLTPDEVQWLSHGSEPSANHTHHLELESDHA